MKRIFLFYLGLSISFPLTVLASSSPVNLTIGESKLIHVESAKKVAIGNPEIADVTAVSDQEILLSAKSAGNTNLIFISPDGEKETRLVSVSSHNLKKSMVEVGVEIMEIDSQSALKAGLSWGSVSAPVSAGSAGGPAVPNNLTIGESSPPPLVAFGSFTRQSLTASLQLLIDRGKAKILSKPKLLAVSGSEASFLSGGEIPYVSQSNLGSSNVQWKPYGVKLKIKPSIDGEDNISADLRVEVSGIDNANGVATGNGVIIPALSTRWAETSVYMKSGSTLVIAGLINENDQRLTSGIPLLSDIPILGELFRFTNDQKTQTELVIFVTPSLVGQSGSEN